MKLAGPGRTCLELAVGQRTADSRLARESGETSNASPVEATRSSCVLCPMHAALEDDNEGQSSARILQWTNPDVHAVLAYICTIPQALPQSDVPEEQTPTELHSADRNPLACFMCRRRLVQWRLRPGCLSDRRGENPLGSVGAVKLRRPFTAVFTSNCQMGHAIGKTKKVHTPCRMHRQPFKSRQHLDARELE
jgi:hypothetical protein